MAWGIVQSAITKAIGIQQAIERGAITMQSYNLSGMSDTDYDDEPIDLTADDDAIDAAATAHAIAEIQPSAVRTVTCSKCGTAIGAKDDITFHMQGGCVLPAAPAVDPIDAELNAQMAVLQAQIDAKRSTAPAPAVTAVSVPQVTASATVPYWYPSADTLAENQTAQAWSSMTTEDSLRAILSLYLTAVETPGFVTTASGKTVKRGDLEISFKLPHYARLDCTQPNQKRICLGGKAIIALFDNGETDFWRRSGIPYVKAAERYTSSDSTRSLWDAMVTRLGLAQQIAAEKTRKAEAASKPVTSTDPAPATVATVPVAVEPEGEYSTATSDATLRTAENLKAKLDQYHQSIGTRRDQIKLLDGQILDLQGKVADYRRDVNMMVQDIGATEKRIMTLITIADRQRANEQAAVATPAPVAVAPVQVTTAPAPDALRSKLDAAIAAMKAAGMADAVIAMAVLQQASA